MKLDLLIQEIEGSSKLALIKGYTQIDQISLLIHFFLIMKIKSKTKKLLTIDIKIISIKNQQNKVLIILEIS